MENSMPQEPPNSSPIAAKSPFKLAMNMDQFNTVAQKRWLYLSAFEWGTDGFAIGIANRKTRALGSIIVSHAMYDESDWLHASISYKIAVPEYYDLVWLHRAVFGRKRWAFQVFTPEGKDHVNYHPNALHLWGRADGKNALPQFSLVEGHI
jgi:hypothetical protein